ncbi:MAG: Rpn family recombination-promoting nuclease/putative transposase [Oscillospiraceae bacterium]|nr:Rpn family recombination-promoting nuclease/putative transposase [Oscillospiraceae bacterium]
MFKTLMTHPDAEPILRDVVESYLRFPVVKVEVKNVELPVSDINEKRERFDVNCTINDGTQFEIEMQSDTISGDSAGTNHKIVKSRAIYHLCDLHSGQSGRNVRYDKLMRSFQMTFCGYTVFPERKDFVRRFSLRDENGVELSDSVGIIFVELTKLAEAMKKPIETLTGEEFWALFLAIGSDPTQKELLDKMIAARREIGMAVELLQTISRDENERARFRARRKFQMDMEHSLIVAQDEAVMRVAKNMLADGEPIEKIIRYTNLTRTEVEGLCAVN